MLVQQQRESREIPPFREWLEEVTPQFNWGWDHLQLIFDVLDRVARKEVLKLMIFMPPRHGKSEAVTIRFPVWCMERNPELRVIVGAYSKSLSETFSRKSRGIARQRFKLSDERATAGDWETEEGGGLRAVGVGSGVTGHGAHIILIDDPIKSREEANSRAYRERVWGWYKDDLYTRQEPECAIIIIMTRWHEDDLAGKIIASEDGPNWTVITLPAIAEADDILGRPIGAPLCPERYDLAALMDRKRVLGHGFYALFQQRPMPREGDFFKRGWFGLVPQVPATIQNIVRYWDRGATEKGGDFTAGVLMGFAGGTYYVLDVVRGQWDSEERDTIIKQTASLDRQFYGAGAVQIWQEREGGSSGKDAGISFVKMLRGFPAFTETVSGKGDKAIRAEPFQAQAMVRAVLLVAGRWNEAFLEELASFPFGAHDDQVDASSGAFRRVIVRMRIAEATETSGDDGPATGREHYIGRSVRGKV